MLEDSIDVVSYEYADQSLIRERRTQDPQWENKVRKKVYERVSWNKSWRDEAQRPDTDDNRPREQSLDDVLKKRVDKSVVGQFLDDAKIPANREVREAMIEILEYDWKSFTVKQWKKFAANNDFIGNPISSLAKAVLKNERINCRWVEAIATALRLIASGITKIGKSLKRFKLLHHLSLGGNEIREIDGQDLPPDLRVLELSGNRISSVEKLANRAPKSLIFLGLSRNGISNEPELQSIGNCFKSLRVLDLEDNYLSNLTDVLAALKPLETLRALILEGNPCSTCLGYKNALLATFPNLIYLDNVVVKPSDKLSGEWTEDIGKLSSGVLFIHVYRIFLLEAPPKLKGQREKFKYFFEVDLPLLDTHLILREEMQIVREEFAKTGVELAVPENPRRVTKERARGDNKVRVTAFRTEEFEWKETLVFNEPALEIPPYRDELKLLSDTFKSVVTVRLVRQQFPPVDDKTKGSQSPSDIEVKERTVICELTCALKNMSWADRSQDFSWTLDESKEKVAARSVPPGILPRQTYLREEAIRGGAFLVPYLLMLFLCGIPLFFMESCMGQFAGTGCITMFRMSPLFKGAGFAIVIVNVICTMYYNVIISYPLMFLSVSFRSKLPWEDCDNPWNTDRCVKINDGAFLNASDKTALFQRVRTPAEEFFSNHVLQISEGVDEIGGIVWPLFTCNLISWLVVFLCISNGVKSVGKVVYFTATFPFVVLFVLFVRGVTLPGAMEGIIFYISPKWSELTNMRVWADAAIQIFFSLGPGWGGIVNMASYNKFRNDNRLDSILVPLLNCGTSIFAGFVVFSVLGFMAKKTGLPVSAVATGGPSLAFETYPEAITMLPWPQFWSILFFSMLYFLGMDSCFVQIEAIISSVTDAYPNLRKRKKLVAGLSMFVLFLGSLVYVTNGGMYILQMFDWYAASISVISICFVEVIVVGWTYGCEQFVRDVEFMLGKKIHPWWPFAWKYLTPIILSFIFFTTIVFNTRLTYNGIAYPEWAVNVGWCSCVVSMLCIPLYAIYHLCSSKGTFGERFEAGVNPTEDWGPQKADDREAWKKYMQRFEKPDVIALDSVKRTDL